MTSFKEEHFSKISIYFHWPWCTSICPYCDFNVRVKKNLNEKEWVKIYLKELKRFSKVCDNVEVQSIYFGGGTPSLMSKNTIEQLINGVLKNYSISKLPEITLEGNPSSLNQKSMKDFYSSGINRLSIGIQSFNDKKLKFLGRDHSAKDAYSILNQAQKIFSRTTFDIIYGLPDDSLKSWDKDLNELIKIALNQGHMSCYQLTIEKRTPFYKKFNQGEIILPNDETLADLYLLTSEKAEKFGLLPYEISNHAIKGQESIHNLGYWNYNQYIGIGPGAHSRISYKDKYLALTQIKSPILWYNKINSNGNGSLLVQPLSKKSILVEILLMGLRLIDGVSAEKFNLFSSLTLKDLVLKPKIFELVENNFLKWDNLALKTTKSGRLVLNKIIDIFNEEIPENFN